MVSQKSAMPSEHPRVFIKKYFKPMARDLGEDVHKIFELPIRVFQTFYGISSCCRATRQIVLAPCVAKAERGQSW